MGEDWDDLLGPDHEDEPEAKLQMDGGRITDAQQFQRPVSVTFLIDVMGMERRNIKKKLADCPPIGYHRGNVPLYDFRQALPYLVKPKVNVARHIQKMGSEDLPKALQKDVWDAKLKRQTWEERARQLWRSEDVIEVLSEAFKSIKSATRLWVDQLADEHHLSDELRNDLRDLVDGLQKSLHDRLVRMPEERQTRSSISEIDGIDDEEIKDV